jgi:hypothetical protein
LCESLLRAQAHPEAVGIRHDHEVVVVALAVAAARAAKAAELVFFEAPASLASL